MTAHGLEQVLPEDDDLLGAVAQAAGVGGQQDAGDARPQVCRQAAGQGRLWQHAPGPCIPRTRYQHKLALLLYNPP